MINVEEKDPSSEIQAEDSDFIGLSVSVSQIKYPQETCPYLFLEYISDL